MQPLQPLSPHLPPSRTKHLLPVPLHEPPIRRIRRANRRPNRPSPKPHQSPRSRTPPTHSSGNQDPESTTLRLQAQRPTVQRLVMHGAQGQAIPFGTTSPPSWECHRICAASSPSKLSPNRMSYSHTAQRSSYASRTSRRNRGSRGVYSLTFLPLRGIGSSSPWEGGPAASSTASRMS